MAVLPIRIYPDPVLRVACPTVTEFDAALKKLVEDMTATMYEAPGIGLAAPQVGVELQLALVNVDESQNPEGLYVLVNPVIDEGSGEETELEGCLSIPMITEKVTRPEWIRMHALDADGKPFELKADGLLARAIQHEIDHLHGVLFIDRLRGLRKDRARRRLRRFRQQQEETWAAAESLR